MSVTNKKISNNSSRCYVNASLQALFSIKVFTDVLDIYSSFLPDLDKFDLYSKDGCITHEEQYKNTKGQNATRYVENKQFFDNYHGIKALCTLWNNYKTGKTKVYDNNPLFCLTILPVNTHQDAQELVTYITNGLTKCDLFTINSKDVSVFKDIFDHSTISCITCSVCGTKYENTVSGSIYQLSQYLLEKNITAINISDAVRLSNEKVENLTGSEQYMCSKCNKKHVANKQIYLSLYPNIFIFQQVLFDSSLNKISSFIEFAEDLTIVDGAITIAYKLISLILQSGSTSGGHYVAHCKRGNKWFTFDDDNEFVESDKLSPPSSFDPYIAFYQKISTTPTPTPTTSTTPPTST